MKIINFTICFVLFFVNIVNSSIFNTLLVHTNYKNISQRNFQIYLRCNCFKKNKKELNLGFWFPCKCMGKASHATSDKNKIKVS